APTTQRSQRSSQTGLRWWARPASARPPRGTPLVTAAMCLGLWPSTRPSKLCTCISTSPSSSTSSRSGRSCWRPPRASRRRRQTRLRTSRCGQCLLKCSGFEGEGPGTPGS
ncbi:hypothetical protein HK405_003792, partial [Cladochytrium tenue]